MRLRYRQLGFQTKTCLANTLNRGQQWIGFGSKTVSQIQKGSFYKSEYFFFLLMRRFPQELVKIKIRHMILSD